ncbi:RnfABCDGE type electron transport complex subunit D [Cohnella lupini]|uniref:NQR2/RnfD/RnfE family subunit of NADH-ubiquinone oxidoreductase n=1 Tax=Cohnella lupini TaxID=1294267 RepID=A0A3D9HZ87_9BACL|nr:RnfABCDGE type electron transport complex subunit D [Cohnella lupini]RED54730.1 NQR2/RnfD/RnfE family subunit of NADH-ubiquinone oxidoreductase [Cohnella lupini]
MTLNRWAQTPKGFVSMLLITNLLVSCLWGSDWDGMIQTIVAVGSTVALDVLISFMKKKKHLKPDGALITGLLISLVLSVTTPWPIVVATSLLAIVSKHVLVVQKRPIFNPAVLGLGLSVMIFHSEQSWWGAFGDLPASSIPLLLIAGLYITGRINKFPQVLSFLGISFLCLLIASIFHIEAVYDAFRPPFINATLFFGFFMLTDLPTSPTKYSDQTVFGMLTAVIGVLDYVFFGGLVYLFLGLIFGNLFQAYRTWRRAGVRRDQKKSSMYPDRRGMTL